MIEPRKREKPAIAGIDKKTGTYHNPPTLGSKPFLNDSLTPTFPSFLDVSKNVAINEPKGAT